jgi:hypothetical protein
MSHGRPNLITYGPKARFGQDKEQTRSMAEKKENQKESVKWDDRILCSDESCIGIIGPDGRCKTCGKPYAGQLPPDFLSHLPAGHDPDALQREDPLLEPQSDAPEETDPDEAENDAIDWDNRVLCSDENCIGIIGPDGRCKTCGKPYKEPN